MRRVYLSQVNYQYGKNTFLPYSAGRLWAYAKQQPEIAKHYKLGGLLFLREPIDEVLERLEDPDVFGGSCYIWNWEYTTTLARRIKERWPNCLIVLGGPQVPNNAEGFFEAHPYVNVIVQAEGERSFSRILTERLAGVRHGAVHKRVIMRPDRVEDLSNLPSPYLNGVFDDLIKLPYDFHASQETNRGCPYRCTFCDWGSATMSKVRAIPEMMVAVEIDWFAKNRIELIYNCDANWGMLKQDEAHTAKLVESKATRGWPKQFRAAYAKKVTPRVRRIAKQLSDADMSKGVTLSVQSMNERTLDLVKRKNTSLDDLAGLVRDYRAEHVPTYTEVILGLPGETYDSFANGLEKIIEAGQHESINIYPAIKLDNSEMGDPAYMLEHGIRTVRMPMLLLHGSPGHDECQETYELVVETRNMSHEDWRRAYVFGWVVQAFHCLGLTRVVAIGLRQNGVSYRHFYEQLIGWARWQPDTVIGGELQRINALLNDVLDGKPWDTMVGDAGNITWPPEESAFLRIMKDTGRFYWELAAFLSFHGWTRDGAYLNSGLMVSPGDFTSFEDYAREIVWYGRKGGQFMDPSWAETLKAEGGENESISDIAMPVHG